MDCPSEQTLANYIAGIATEADSTAEHVDQCERCRSAVEWLQVHPQPSDPENSELFDETGAYPDKATGLLDGHGYMARFDPSIFGPAESDDALGTLGK